MQVISFYRVVLILLILLGSMGVCGARSSATSHTDELSGTLEVMEVIVHEQDPWHAFRDHLAGWWIDEHTAQIEQLRQQRFTDREQRAERDEMVRAMQTKIKELQREQRHAEREAERGMVEVRGWDPARADDRYPSKRVGGSIVIECREPAMMKKAKRLEPGHFVDYIVVEEKFRAERGALNYAAPYDQSTLSPKRLEHVREPAGFAKRDESMSPLRFETVDVTADAEVEVEQRMWRQYESQHEMSVLEVRQTNRKSLSPELREVKLRIEVVDENTGAVVEDRTPDGPFVVRVRWVGGGIGWGPRDTDRLQGILRMPYPPPPDGKVYRFTVESVRAVKR